MAERDYSAYQQKVIQRYYENKDQIDEQRLSELVTNLYLAPPKKQAKMWESAEDLMNRMKLPPARIEHVMKTKDPAVLARLVEELQKGLVKRAEYDMERRPMTVLQLLPALEGGGVERGVLEVGAALAGAGHRSLVVSGGGRLVAGLLSHGSEHFQCSVGAKTPWTLRWIPWLKRLMQKESVDVVDVHSRLPGWIGLLAWKSLPAAVRPALVTSFHGLHSPGRYSSIMCRGQRVVVVSETMRDHVLKNYPWVPPERLRLIHRGIEAAEFPRGYAADACWTSDFLHQFPQLKGQSLVTVVGRISRLKGHSDFLKIMADLRQRGLSAHGLIVGGYSSGRSSLRTELRELIHRLRLTGHVTLTGPQRDVRQIYAMSKVVLSVSQKPESFGRTVAEALSVGTPVVGYEHGGVGEILTRQFPVGAVPAGDVAAATEATARLLTAAQLPAIGPNPFTRQQMLTETLRLYGELCDGRLRTAA